MRSSIVIELMKKYAECPVCGSNRIGKGALVVKHKTFHRKCSCGWTVEVKDND